MNKFGIIICLLATFLQGCSSSEEIAQAQQNKPVVEKTVSEVTPKPIESINELGANTNAQKTIEVLIDSNLSLAEAIGNQEIPDQIRKELDLVEVEYYSFDGKLHKGQIVIHNSLKEDVAIIFREIKENKFPIAKIIPVSRYDFSDDKSMEDNNTSAFNYRKKTGSNELSNHALGKAIDINPLFNPYIKDGKISPSKAKYDPTVPGTITEDSFVVKIFKKRGWKWGGDWKTLKDYQHFEK